MVETTKTTQIKFLFPTQFLLLISHNINMSVGFIIFLQNIGRLLASTLFGNPSHYLEFGPVRAVEFLNLKLSAINQN